MTLSLSLGNQWPTPGERDCAQVLLGTSPHTENSPWALVSLSNPIPSCCTKAPDFPYQWREKRWPATLHRLEVVAVRLVTPPQIKRWGCTHTQGPEVKKGSSSFPAPLQLTLPPPHPPPGPSQDSELWYTFLDPWETVANTLTPKKRTSNQLLIR